MSEKIGLLAKIYRNTGTYNSPTWVEIDYFADVTVTPSWDEAEASTRATRIKTVAKTLLGLEVSGKIRVDDTNAGYVAIRDAFFSPDPIDLLVLNGPSDEDGVHGWRADWHVMGMPEDQALTAFIFADVMLKPAISANLPKKAIVESSAPVFSEVEAV